LTGSSPARSLGIAPPKALQMSDDLSKVALAAVSALTGFLASIFTTYIANRSAQSARLRALPDQTLRRADLCRDRGEELYVK